MQIKPKLGLTALLAWIASCAAPADRYEASERVLEFAGQSWEIRQGPNPGGAGFNHWGTGEESVAQSESGLALTLTHDGQLWRAAEVRAPLPVGTARVEFSVEMQDDAVADNVVLGLFVYTDDEHEADVECSRWGDEQAAPWQFALHTRDGHQVERFGLPGSSSSIHTIAWTRRSVSWSSESGAQRVEHTMRLGVARRLGVRFVHINLWLDRGRPPGDGVTRTLIRDVRFYNRRGQRIAR